MSAIVSADAELVRQIRSCADGLPKEAHEVVAMLFKYASEIENPATNELSVKAFDEFAWHWKGLRDLIVPGVAPKNWKKQVQILSKLARSSIKARRGPSWWRRLLP